MSGSRIKALQASLFGTRQYVCGGHGARWPSDGTFVVPTGIVIHFYVPDGDSLSNDIGQKVDQVLAGGTAPAAVETIRSGSPCHDYRLFSNKAGGYLNLAMSTGADQRYITEQDKDNGRHLSDIVKWVISQTPNAEIHWSACRSIESGTDVFDWDSPTYSPALLGLGGSTGP
jgi:hypothetical protein